MTRLLLHKVFQQMSSTLHFLKRYVLSKILIKKKAFYFSKRALRAGKVRNKWLKKALPFKIFFIQSILLFFAKYLSKKCMNDNKSKLRVHRRLLVIAFFQQTEWRSWGVTKAELFPYLSNVIVKDKVVVSTVDENVVTNGPGLDISSLMKGTLFM